MIMAQNFNIPIPPPITILNPALGVASAVAPGLVHGAEQAAAGAISQSVLGPLFQANIWIRVGEVLLGVVLIAAGVARLTHAIPIATKVAQTAGAAAVL